MNDLEKIKVEIEKLDELYKDFLGKLNERDEIIKNKDHRIEELTEQLAAISREKDTINAEKQSLVEKNKDQMTQITNLKLAKKTAQDTVMGVTMDRDQKNKELEEKVRKIIEMEERIGKVAGGSTGIIYSLEDAIQYMKGRIQSATRSLRIVVPTLSFFDRFGLHSLLDQLGPNCNVNIATELEKSRDQAIIDKWKARGYILTAYNQKNLFCVSANGEDVEMAFIKEDTVSGFFTDINDLVIAFNQAMMHAFLKGYKL
jgi:hypothetical protein